MRSFTSLLTTKSKPLLRDLLNSSGPGFFEIYNRRFSTNRLPESKLAEYTHLAEMSDDISGHISRGLFEKIKPSSSKTKARVIDLQNSSVMQTRALDLELTKEDRFGQLILTSQDDMLVKYGSHGIVPSESKKPTDLLVQSLFIPKKSFGVLDIRNHTSFLIEAKNPTASFALSIANTVDVVAYDRQNIESMCSIETCVELPEDLARRVHIKIQDRIFSDRTNERFYEEVTSVVDKPTHYNSSSGTLMNFERVKFGVDNTTDSHYHPGDRRLHIYTIGKEAGVTLNFCGIAEDPNHRKDCEVYISFPPNSLCVLKFPAYTHHKFHGDFAADSVHPLDGAHIIDAVKHGTLPHGFLESATVFSPTEENQKRWNLSLPDKSTEVDTKSHTK